MKTYSLRKTLLAALAAVLVQGSASASTIFWESAFNDLLYDSNGLALDAGFSFEIGTFGGFVPTLANINDWDGNWKVFDRAFDPDANGWNTVDQFFTGTVDHLVTGESSSADAVPGTVFTQGETAFLWVYNTKARNLTTEWALLGDGTSTGDAADDWIIPDPADPPGTSYVWQLADLDQVVFGGGNNVQGSGSFTTDPGTFSLQTHLVPVPEPGSALLVLLTVGLWATRCRSGRGASFTIARESH